MTYLEAVNKVLLRLRENQVSTVQGSGNSNTYARLIGEFINEAKDQVESAWDWSSLRTTMTATTSEGVFSYELNGCGENTKLLDAFNDTSDLEMMQKTSSWFNNAYLTGAASLGTPVYYSFNGLSSDGDLFIDVFPPPDGVYNLRFNVVKRTTALSADTDTIEVPTRPIILLATAMAIEERGEDGGQQSVNAYIMAQNALSDAIAFDAGRMIEDTEWYTV